MVRGQKHMACKVRLRDLDLFSLVKSVRGTQLQPTTSTALTKMLEPRSLWPCQTVQQRQQQHITAWEVQVEH